MSLQLTEKYYGLGYDVEDCPPPAGYKDYNEWLVAAKTDLIGSQKVEHLSENGSKKWSTYILSGVLGDFAPLTRCILDGYPKCVSGRG